jgi:hypothetical protein
MATTTNADKDGHHAVWHDFTVGKHAEERRLPQGNVEAGFQRFVEGVTLKQAIDGRHSGRLSGGMM